MVRSVDSRVVLVVDDEVFARLLAVQIFLDQGFTVLEAEDAEGALDALDRNDDVGLLFTDVSMPGALDGLQLIERVTEASPHIRCIATSGQVDPRRCTLPPAARFVPKPYTAYHLMEAIRQSESDPRQQRAAA
jgi:DNA-binding NtrC family response regulator